MERLLVTMDEAAAAMSIGRTKLYELMRLGVIETVQIGRSRRVSSRSVREYVDTLRGSPSAPDGLLSAGR